MLFIVTTLTYFYIKCFILLKFHLIVLPTSRNSVAAEEKRAEMIDAYTHMGPSITIIIYSKTQNEKI